MIFTEHQVTLETFIKEQISEDLINNAIKAAEYAGFYDRERWGNDLLVINVDGYYNIVEVLNNEDYCELDTTVYPFDHNRVYPMQRIEQKISYKIYR